MRVKAGRKQAEGSKIRAPRVRHGRPRDARTTLDLVKALEREVRHKEQALAEAQALVALLQKSKGLVLGGRGRLHDSDVRLRVCRLVAEAVMDGSRQSSACRLLGISGRTIQRWRQPERAQDGRLNARRRPTNRLSDEERQLVVELLHSPPFKGLSPRELVPRLADQGIYLASESTMYRLLRLQKRAPVEKFTPSLKGPGQERIVSAPNQIWSWDITYLKGLRKGSSLYLYLMMDVFSRRIMGWQVHMEERAEHAATFIRTACEQNSIKPAGLVLHSDNGRPMRGAEMLCALRGLGITPSFSRPQVSNDNPYVEALFRTLKRHPNYPATPFASLSAARAWVARFVSWYNGEHLHGSLGFVSPNDRYFGREESVLAARRAVYARAWRHSPVRWPRGLRCWLPPEAPRVWLRTLTYRLERKAVIAR
ncbi:IS3 family transposase [Vitiosangium sp. GDMCC 1.1324]|uniref:IS3 family transposase n=1 Tax=Vitiosangium sp. (strain GDMCC 1.1324) TaxID=2138576 RepID=UPI00130E1B2B|nr:IS3 family transposase [Vitiosangium sp. GDMCC 1.1324]